MCTLSPEHCELFLEIKIFGWHVSSESWNYHLKTECVGIMLKAGYKCREWMRFWIIKYITKEKQVMNQASPQLPAVNKPPKMWPVTVVQLCCFVVLLTLFWKAISIFLKNRYFLLKLSFIECMLLSSASYIRDEAKLTRRKRCCLKLRTS